ncbi:MAG TPA: cation diffusion facilitator family transporter [Beijerinckiaceae bacterium]|jgi:cation diffusion facilitator family transporter
MTKTARLAIGSIVVGLAVLALKTVAYWMTGSVALLSDALESTVNVATAVAAYVAIRIAARPADDDHPYGHHKAEFFSAGIEGAMIVVAALLILRESWAALQAPRALEAPLGGLLVNALASVVNGAWCWVLIRWGRRHHSPALVADGHHLLSDVVSSIGVTAGVLVAIATGWYVLDPALAGLVALNILWSGYKVVRRSVSGLMDESLPESDLRDLRATISSQATGALEAHDLRTRHAGRATFIEFHLIVPGGMSVSAAHEICDRIERAIRDRFAGAVITIHVEPEEKAKHHGVLVI